MDEEKAGGDIDFDFFDSASNEHVQTPKLSKTDSPSKVISKPPTGACSPRTQNADNKNRSATPSLSDSQSDGYSDDSFDSDVSDSESDRLKCRKDSLSNASETDSDSDTRSRSRSRSSSRNDRSSKRKHRRHSSDSSVSSSSTFSDTNDDNKFKSEDRKIKESSNDKDKNRKEAWSIDDKKDSESSDKDTSTHKKISNTISKPPRPKTAFDRRPNQRGHSEEGRPKTRLRSRSVSDSDSEMTDVSPLPSPRDSPRNIRRKKSNISTDLNSERSNTSFRREVQYQAMPLSRDDSCSVSSNALDLNLLMKAVSDLEKQKRLKANTRRVMFEPPKGRANDRNYTFDKDRAKIIEKENQRLLNEIIHRNPQKKQSSSDTLPVYRMTHSAVNRQRQQRKIEMENFAFLKRLQKIKPSKGMSKTDQIKDYSNTMLYGVPYAAVREMQARTSRSTSTGHRSSTPGSLKSAKRTNSMTSIQSAASSTISSRQSRSSRSLDNRPAWSDKW